MPNRSQFNMKAAQCFSSMQKAVVLLLALGSLYARGIDFAEEGGEELRLRLGDRTQEMRTTSVNWLDLTPETAARPRDGHPSDPPRVFRVVVDAGHGGRDLGATGYGVLEKDLCLKIARLVRRQLERYRNLRDLPLEVKLSRDSDNFIPLDERVRIANEWNADLFVSIHGNASEFPRARGFEVYFLNAEASDAKAKSLARFENESEGSGPLEPRVLSILADVQVTQHVSESSRFAETIYSSLSQRFRANGRGVRQAPFKVLHGTAMPAVLVEVGYLTNVDEAKRLRKGPYLKRLAGAISTGIIDFAQNLRKLI